MIVIKFIAENSYPHHFDNILVFRIKFVRIEDSLNFYQNIKNKTRLSSLKMLVQIILKRQKLEGGYPNLEFLKDLKQTMPIILLVFNSFKI